MATFKSMSIEHANDDVEVVFFEHIDCLVQCLEKRDLLFCLEAYTIDEGTFDFLVPTLSLWSNDVKDTLGRVFASVVLEPVATKHNSHVLFDTSFKPPLIQPTPNSFLNSL